ncbi:CobW family GTP-binding protein [Rubrobacter marinus]|uniref:CobW family GTP-binding protein n=1 Tax=Rubrobacter marinus TaxID=2653852 RepID=UPI00224BA49A|nr:GTP-binding protein [Rubrobacter marinus]
MTVVTGFLGSGKTTLLSRVLSDPSMSDTAVLVNEFGKVGLDHHLLRRADEKTVLLGHGCVCCTTRDDLVEAMLGLLDEEGRGEIPPLKGVVVETTGLADPAPILYTVFSHPVLQHHYRVDRVICTVDAVNGALHLDRNAESTKQIAAADVAVLTKTDVSDAGTVDALRARIRGINPSARVLEAPFGDVRPEELFGDGSTDPSGPRAPAVDLGDGGHVSETHSTSLTFDGPVDWTAFGTWFSMLLHARGEDVLRVKGLLDVGGPGPVLLNGVQHVIHPPDHLEEWPDGDHESRIVFITRGIRAEEIVDSLETFSGLIGARPQPLESDVRV